MNALPLLRYGCQRVHLTKLPWGNKVGGWVEESIQLPWGNMVGGWVEESIQLL